MSTSTFTLNCGHKIPVIGLGTWQSSADDVKDIVTKAIEIGYRHIDTAFVYRNEEAVGAGIKAAIESGFVTREDLFVTTKLWGTFHEYEDVKTGCKESLKKLGLEYIDLYLIHFPIAFKTGEDLWPKGENGETLTTDCDYLDTWKGMEELVDEGLVKAIGVSNFNVSQVQRILDNCRIKPAMQQVELHPRFRNDELLNFCQKNDILVTAFFSLGNLSFPEATHKKTWSLLEDPTVTAIAEKYGKTPAQVLIHWPVQRGICAIPKTVTPQRLKENFDIFDFTLTDEEIQALASFTDQERIAALRMFSKHKYYPHTDVEN